MSHHVILKYSVTDSVFVQVAEARQRHQLEREEIQRESALEQRRLAQEERQAAAERVYTISTALQHGHTPGLFVYNQATLAQPLLEVIALLPRCTAFLLAAAGAEVVLVVLSCCMGVCECCGKSQHAEQIRVASKQRSDMGVTSQLCSIRSACLQ